MLTTASAPAAWWSSCRSRSCDASCARASCARASCGLWSRFCHSAPSSALFVCWIAGWLLARKRSRSPQLTARGQLIFSLGLPLHEGRFFSFDAFDGPDDVLFLSATKTTGGGTGAGYGRPDAGLGPLLGILPRTNLCRFFWPGPACIWITTYGILLLGLRRKNFTCSPSHNRGNSWRVEPSRLGRQKEHPICAAAAPKLRRFGDSQPTVARPGRAGQPHLPISECWDRRSSNSRQHPPPYPSLASAIVPSRVVQVRNSTHQIPKPRSSSGQSSFQAHREVLFLVLRKCPTGATGDHNTTVSAN